MLRSRVQFYLLLSFFFFAGADAAALPARSSRDRQPAPTESGRVSSSQLTSIRVIEKPGWTRIIVQLDEAPTYMSGHLTKPERVYFDLPHTRLSPGLRKPEIGDHSPVAAIRVAQFSATTTRIVLELTGRGICSAFLLPNPDRLVIDVSLTDPHATPSAQTGRTTSGAKLSSDLQLIRALGLQVRRVVIDAGHGGHDTGTIGPRGTKEKDIVLGIALRLGRLLKQKLGVKVVYTRSSDVFVPLQVRTAIANRAHADLFISIHANSSRRRTVRGIETYYLDFAATPEAMAVAARENAGSPASIARLQHVVRQIALNEKANESKLLAASVDTALYGALSGREKSVENRGVKTAPFVVLIGANMPSILVETSFLSNPVDERRLRSAAYRQKIALALLRGISAYIESLGTVRLASN